MQDISDELTTNCIPNLDKQHEEFLNIIRKLNSAHKTQDNIWAAFIFIENYIRNHFAQEENCMKSVNYNEYDSHRESHEKFIEEYKEISEEITSYESADKILPSLKNFLENWVIKHCQDEDKKLVLFLKEHQ